MADTAPSPKNILRGHKAQIHVATFIRDNERLVTGDAQGYVILWDLAVMRPTAVWKAHDNAILGIEGWGPDKITTHGRDHKLIVWRLAADDEPGLSTVLPVEDAPQSHRQPWVLYLLEVNAFNFCSFAACAGRDQEGCSGRDASSDVLLVAVPNTLASDAIDIYTLPSQSRIHTIKPGSKNGMAMCLRLLYHGACLTLLAGFENGCASAHRLDTAGQWITTYRSKAHSQPVLSLDVHPSHEYFLTSSADSILAKHPIPTARQTLCVSVSSSGQTRDVVEAVSERGNLGKSLAASEALKSIAGPPTEKSEEWKHPLKTVNTKHSGQQSLRVRSDGKIFATAGWDSKIRVYSCRSLKELAVLQWHKLGAYAVAFAQISGHAASITEGDPQFDKAAQHPAVGSSARWNMTPPVGTLSTTGTSVKERRIIQAKTAHWIAAGAKDGKVSLWTVY